MTFETGRRAVEEEESSKKLTSVEMKLRLMSRE